MGLGEGGGDGLGEGGGDGMGEGVGDGMGERRGGGRRGRRGRIGGRKGRFGRRRYGGSGGGLTCCGAGQQVTPAQDLAHLRLAQAQMLIYLQQGGNNPPIQSNTVFLGQANSQTFTAEQLQVMAAHFQATSALQPGNSTNAQLPPNNEANAAAYAAAYEAAMQRQTGQTQTREQILEGHQQQQMEILQAIMAKQATEKDPEKLQELFKQQNEVIDQMNELQKAGYTYKTDIPTYGSAFGEPAPQIVHAHNVT